MHCERCNARVSETLLRLNGVTKAVVETARRRSTPVLVVGQHPLTRVEVTSAIESVGFSCRPLRSENR
ncbi:copper chaperone CopZ [Kineosphaera limosa]|nr:copper chaperone CopZ [Kineosphaera limosa]